MSNYQSLKATIDANIKRNGRQEITGQVLNSVLNALLTSLGSGYQFMGLATPSGQPTPGDKRVVYLTSEAGTYTNYGGIVVTKLSILYYDTAWHKSEVDIPFGGSSGAVWGSITGTLQNQTDLKNALNGKQDTISDLSTIRSGAASGATAYQKPSTGIPKTDLASGVQTSLGKADTALQSVPSSYDNNVVHKTGMETIDGAKLFKQRIGIVSEDTDGEKLYLASQDDGERNILNVSGTFGSSIIRGIEDPLEWSDAANKNYVDNHHDSTKANDSQVVKVVAQSLTSTDQAQARTNINAQEKIVAGSGITIAEDGKTISASGGGGSSTPSGDPCHYLYVASGATWNASTSKWELNGMTDISSNDMAEIYTNGHIAIPLGRYKYSSRKIRTTIPLQSVAFNYATAVDMGGLFYGCDNLEVIKLTDEASYGNINNMPTCTAGGFQVVFYGCTKLKDASHWNVSNATSIPATTFNGCQQLERVMLRGVKVNVSIPSSPNLTAESVAYMITNAGTATITITLHATAYARAIADADVQSALASKTNVTLASA